MKHFSVLTVILVAAIFISACGAPAAPTVNPVDVQHTAEAAAFTMVAQTQAARPTDTLLPPTETPTQTAVPTDTPQPLPTLDVTFTATGAPASNATGDPCNRSLAGSPKGRETIIRIANMTRVPIKVSLYLSETAAHGECGYRGYEIGKNNDVVITDLVQGCYSLLAWSDDPKGKFSSTGGGCINNPDKWTFEVSASNIKFVGP
jgi:hypothetical protein